MALGLLYVFLPSSGIWGTVASVAMLGAVVCVWIPMLAKCRRAFLEGYQSSRLTPAARAQRRRTGDGSDAA